MKLAALQWNDIKTLPPILWVLLAVGIAGPIFFYTHHFVKHPAVDRKEISPVRSPRHRHEIQGFRYAGNLDGKKVISIKADRFSIQKKKLGFFRFGLLNEVRFDNAFVHIYGRIKPVKKTGDPIAHNRPQIARGRPQIARGRPQKNLTFNALFTKDSLPSFPVKRISSIVLQPVYVALHDEQSEVSRISAASAVIRLRKKDILFKGNVKVLSGSRVLTTDRLRMLPARAVIETEGPFVMQTPERRLKGQHLTSTIFLTDESFRSPQNRAGG